MVNIFSKFQPIYVSCREIHAYQDNCLLFSTDIFIQCFYTSFQLYLSFYLIGLLMRAKIPKLKELRSTLLNVARSTMFLSASYCGYGLLHCALRKLLGSYNIISVSFLPAFLSTGLTLFIERPSRRTLLGVYLSNIATETIWNMLAAREIVRPIKYAQITILGVSMSLLLAVWRAGLYNKPKVEPIFKLLQLINGQNEEQYDANNSNSIQKEKESTCESWTIYFKKKSRRHVFHVLYCILKVHREIINKIKGYGRSSVCSHPFSCLFYTLEGTTKIFSLGLGLQVLIKLLKSPKDIRTMIFRKDTFKMANAFAGFCGIYRVISCVLRRCTGKENPLYALPAGLLAGIAFSQYPDTTISLYVFWKAAQITYNLGIEKGYLPEVPRFSSFLCCLSAGILLHAAILEPQHLTPSYWKFLLKMSAGRYACFDRKPFDVWGLGSSQGLTETLTRTKN